MRVDSIKQYLILKWIEENFILDEVHILLVEDNCVEVMDKNLDFLLLSVNEENEIVIEQGCAFNDNSFLIQTDEKMGVETL